MLFLSKGHVTNLNGIGTYFPENCWVYHASWFPRITALGKLRLAMLWTTSTFSSPKSPIKNIWKSSRKKEKTQINHIMIIFYKPLKNFTSHIHMEQDSDSTS